jgi:hypothetical protein
MDLMLLIPVGFACLVLVVYLIIRREKKRREALREKAQMLGFTYTQKAELNEIGKAGEFHLFNIGHSKRIRNLLERDDGGVQTWLYDYRYTTGGGKHSRTHVQTVFQFESAHLKLPAFILRPENVFHKIGQSFGYRDIDFEPFPEFSRRYLLRGEDEAAIRKLFNQELIARFEAEKALIVEGKGPLLICYRSSKRVRPDDLWTMYESMQVLCKMFIRRCENGNR